MKIEILIMKYIRMILIVLAILVYSFHNGNAQNSCINCHQELEDELKLPVDEMLNEDFHFKNGITCTDCHGGEADVRNEDDMDAAMNPDKGYIGIPKRKDIPKLCSKCHSNLKYIRNYNPNLPTDQYQECVTSQHGQSLAKGDTKVAVCSDCHGVHNIQPANMSTSKIFPFNIPNTCGRCHSNPVYMKKYKIATDQLDLYRESIHGKNLFEKGDRSSPVCNDCHGNHGAFPPGISSISHVCGICHVSQFEMFTQSPHKDAFAELELPQCESCHGNHEVKSTYLDMLGVNSKSLCTTCHDEESQGYLIAEQMKMKEDSLMYKINLADSLLEKAEDAGVEVGDGKFILKDAHDILIKARNSIHYFSLIKFKDIINPGLDISNNAVVEGYNALKELQNRRKWLAFISILIFLTAVSLYFKIKIMKSK